MECRESYAQSPELGRLMPLPTRAISRVLLTFALALGIISAAAGTVATAAGSSVVVTTRSVGRYGTILVNAQGRTLYMFVPDKQHRVTCTGGCALNWPPLKLPAGAKPIAGGKAEAKLLSSDPDPSGGRVVTYNHWPLYTWVADSAPGVVTGEGLDNSGGYWYVIAPSGKIIKT